MRPLRSSHRVEHDLTGMEKLVTVMHCAARRGRYRREFRMVKVPARAPASRRSSRISVHA